MDAPAVEQGIHTLQSRQEIDYAGHRRLYDYWCEKRQLEKFPTAESIDLLDFLDDVSSWALLDVIDGGKDFQVRLCGSRLVEFLGGDMTGKSLVRDMEEPLSTSFQQRLLSIFRKVMDTSVPALVFPHRSTAPEKGYVEVTSLTLPLGGSDTGITRLIHSVHFH